MEEHEIQATVKRLAKIQEENRHTIDHAYSPVFKLRYGLVIAALLFWALLAYLASVQYDLPFVT
jgi:thiosulfate reductase cytochrome b subunit